MTGFTGSLARRYLSLETWSLAYIFLPILIFLAGWVRPAYALPLSLGILWGIAQTVHTAATSPLADDTVENFRLPLLLPALVVIVLVGLSPFGYGIKNYDYPKHISFLRDLTELPYPLHYEQTGTSGKPGFLATYIAYYLPAATVGKLLGWKAAYHALFLWTALGVYLSVLWFFRVVRHRSPVYLLLFLGFGGLDVVGWLLLNGWQFPRNIQWENWVFHYALAPTSSGSATMGGVFWLYADNITFLFWGPHHLLPGLIVLLMTLHGYLYRRSMGSLLLICSTLPLGSAFVTLGMVPYVGLCVVTDRFRSLLTFRNLIVAPLLVLVLGLYITSNNGDYPHGFVWHYQDLGRTWPVLLAFYLLEFGLFYGICTRITTGEMEPRWRPLCSTALVCLLLMPLYRLGTYCDFTTKVAWPSLNVMLLYYLVTIAGATTAQAKLRTRLLLGLMLVGCLSGLAYLGKALTAERILSPAVEIATVRHVNELEPKSVAAQLFSEGTSLFWQHLGRIRQ